MPSDNQKFLDSASEAICSDPDHPLKFLLNQQGTRVMTLERGRGNYFDTTSQAIYQGSFNDGKPTSGLSSSNIADSLGVSLSVDACHLTTKKHGGLERFCLGIAEDNRGHGQTEKVLELHHEAVTIGGVAVDRASAAKWEAAGLLNSGTTCTAAKNDGWSRPDTSAPSFSADKSPPSSSSSLSPKPSDPQNVHGDHQKWLREMQQSMQSNMNGLQARTGKTELQQQSQPVGLQSNPSNIPER